MPAPTRMPTLTPLAAARHADRWPHGSVYDYAGGLNFDGSNFDEDQTSNQMNLTWAMSGFGMQLGIEDPRDRWGTSLSSSYSMPNIVGNISWSQGNWDAKISGGYATTKAGSGFGAQLGTTFKLDQIAKGDQLRLKAAWAQNEAAAFAATTAGSADRPGCHQPAHRRFDVVVLGSVPALLGSDLVVGGHLRLCEPGRWHGSGLYYGCLALAFPVAGRPRAVALASTASTAIWCGLRSPASLLAARLATIRSPQRRLASGRPRFAWSAIGSRYPRGRSPQGRPRYISPPLPA